MTRLALRLAMGGRGGDAARFGLAVLGTAAATGFLLAALLVAAVPETCAEDGGGSRCNSPYSVDLLAQPGLRPGVTTALLLLVVPVLVFLAMCTRINAAARDRRLAALRLAGATARQVRLLAAAEAGLAALPGAGLGWAGFVAAKTVLDARAGTPRPLPTDVALPALPTAGLLLAVPVLAAATALLALRGVITSPLGVARRAQRARPRPWPLVPVAAGVALVAAAPLLTRNDAGDGRIMLLLVGGATLTMLGLVFGSAWLSVLVGRLVVRRSRRPALLLAARRIEADPHGQARAMSAIVLAVYFAAGATVLRAVTLRETDGYDAESADFFRSAYDLVDLALLVALLVASAGLLVAAVESVLERRRSLAALHAVGVPQATLRRAVLLQAALPLAPAVLLATACGATSAIFLTGGLELRSALPLGRLAIVVLLALVAATAVTALTLPMLRRTVLPSELRYE